MNRLLVILALLFGMAAVAGPAMASAQPHVAMAMAVQAHAGPSDSCAVGELTAPKQLTRPCAKINKVLEGRPHIVDAIKNGEVQLVFNTTEGAQALTDSRSLRRTALLHKVPYYTTVSGAVAASEGIRARKTGTLEVEPLQAYVGSGAGTKVAGAAQ